jgi:hypothetical protein
MVPLPSVVEIVRKLKSYKNSFLNYNWQFNKIYESVGLDVLVGQEVLKCVTTGCVR